MTVTPIEPLTPTPTEPKVTPVKTNFLGRLSVPQKIGLITLALSVPLAYSVYNNFTNNSRELRTVENQLVGYSYLQTLEQLMANTQLSRGAISRALSAGQRGEQLNLPEVQKVNEVFAQLEQLAQQSPLSDDISRDIANTKETWEQFTAAVQSPQPPNNQQLSQTFNFLFDNQVLPLTQSVVQASQLNSASDPAVNNLLTVAADVFPGEWNSSGFIRSLTIRGFDSVNQQTGAINPVDQREYQVRLGNARASHNIMVNSLERAIATTPNQADKLQPALEQMQTTMGTVFQNFQAAFLSGPTVGIQRTDALAALQPSFEAEANAYKVTMDALGEELARVERTARNTQLVNTLLLLASLLTAAFLAYLAVRAILDAINNLTRTARRLSLGDFSARTPITSQDELATLGNSLNEAAAQLQENEQRVRQERLEQEQLQNNINSFLDVTMDIAEGDLTKRGVVTEDILGNVVDSINLMTEELSYVLGETRSAASSVTSGSQQMLASTQNIRSGAEQTTEAARRVAEQTAEVNAQVQEMARIAQASAEAARQALIASQQGQAAVQETLSGMQGIRETAQSAEERIAALAERSKQVGEIVNAISHIASQTNLLSLHASIEAAGAGEAGERFSVVAQEVRQLADESAEATARITTLITGIQNEIREVVATMRQNAEQVNLGYNVAGTAGQRLEQIGELSRESARLAEQISLSTRDQVSNIEQVTTSVQGIAETAERSQTSVEQGQAAAEQLQRLADQLNASLARFRLPSS